MRSWDAERVAAAAGARLLRAPRAQEDPPGPARAGIDSRGTEAGELFVGLKGARSDGGAHAPAALRAGAWGVLVAPEHAPAALAEDPAGAILEHPDPLAGLQALALAWREELGRGGTRIVAITGSTGKTSTKDILAALLAPLARTAASPANHNTEIGLPLAILAAGEDVEVLVLEMAMRGRGQIAELTAIARPEVGRDRQRRGRPPGAARLARGDRRGQGRADRRDGERQHRRGAVRGAAAGVAPARRPADRQLRRRRRRRDARRAPPRRLGRDPLPRRGRSSCGRRSPRPTTSETCWRRWRRRGRSATHPKGSCGSSSRRCAASATRSPAAGC